MRLILVALLVVGCGGPAATDSADAVAELHAEYGGDLANYERIFRQTNCNALIREHDLALTEEAAAVAGTSAAFVAHGYGRAAAQRMIALDC